MPRFEDFYFDSSTGVNRIHARRCIPDAEPRGVVQIVHGIAEHINRYDDFMYFLAENGFYAVGDDHLGHGQSISKPEDKGFFAEEDGWNRVLDDLDTLRSLTVKECPGKPYIFFGHSMGSFLTRTYIIENPDKYDAAIISGTGQQPKPVVFAGYALADLMTKTKGPRADGTTLNNIAFGSYNDKIPDKKTEFDWLSRNEENVSRYIDDPLCGFVATVSLYRDMMSGIKFVTKQDNMNRMNKEHPVYFMSGAMDPVGDYGKGVEKAYKGFCKAGLHDVKMKLYPGGRHEMLNEINREEVFSDILNWLNERF